MKVKDLISELSKLDQNLEIYGYCEDSSLQTKDSAYHIFAIDGADSQNVIIGRNSQGKLIATFENEVGSRKMAFINITTDF